MYAGARDIFEPAGKARKCAIDIHVGLHFANKYVKNCIRPI